MVAAVSQAVTAVPQTEPLNGMRSRRSALRVLPPPVPEAVPEAVPASASARELAPARRPARQQIRLTRRGRMVVATLAALLVSALLAVISMVVGAGPAAQATNHPVSRQAAERGLVRVTVLPGQSLWSVAEAADPDADPRVVIPEIVEQNGLSGIVVYPGEQLLVPRG